MNQCAHCGSDCQACGQPQVPVPVIDWLDTAELREAMAKALYALDTGYVVSGTRSTPVVLGFWHPDHGPGFVVLPTSPEVLGEAIEPELGEFARQFIGQAIAGALKGMGS